MPLPSAESNTAHMQIKKEIPKNLTIFQKPWTSRDEPVSFHTDESHKLGALLIKLSVTLTNKTKQKDFGCWGSGTELADGVMRISAQSGVISKAVTDQ